MIRLFLTICLLVSFYSQPVLGQTSDEFKALQEEIRALKEGQKSIKKDLEAIKDFLLKQARQAPRRRGPPPFQPVVLSLHEDPFKGDKNAKLTILDFSDFQ